MKRKGTCRACCWSLTASKLLFSSLGLGSGCRFGLEKGVFLQDLSATTCAGPLCCPEAGRHLEVHLEAPFQGFRTTLALCAEIPGTLSRKPCLYSKP